ncbi:MAG: hypothetical protein IPK75_12610 [Acidobacteria bacterium]|nr:hypothetical protein [Acidobacteriota bacterium]
MSTVEYTEAQLERVQEAADALILTMADCFNAETPAAFLANVIGQVMVAQNRHTGNQITSADAAKAAIAGLLYAVPAPGHLASLSIAVTYATGRAIDIARGQA